MQSHSFIAQSTDVVTLIINNSGSIIVYFVCTAAISWISTTMGGSSTSTLGSVKDQSLRRGGPVTGKEFSVICSDSAFFDIKPTYNH